MIGDSITESLRGTSYGGHSDRSVGTPEVFKAAMSTCPTATPLSPLAAPPNPLVLAISGDQTQHLLFRLANGELPPALRGGPGGDGVTISLLIGTNNIAVGYTRDEVRTALKCDLNPF